MAMNVSSAFFAIEQAAIAAYFLERLARSVSARRRGASYEAQSHERMALAENTTRLLALADAPVRHERDREIAEHEHATRLALVLRAMAEAEHQHTLALIRLATVTESCEEVRSEQQRLETPAVVRLMPETQSSGNRGKRRMKGRPEVLPSNYHRFDHDENVHCGSFPRCEPVV